MNKTEITAKIKKAIESKLCSLGAYVDKELPEYIIVMIANKKSRESMATDLKLFLGEETSNFIDWLHELLEKCHANPDEAFRSKTAEKLTKVKSSDSPDKRKKVDKDKQKIKSKSRKTDEKKDHKKSSNNKPNKTRSRSRSPKSELSRMNDSKKPKSKSTPDKNGAKSSSKRDSLKAVSEKINNKMPADTEIESRKDVKKDTPIIEVQTVEPKIITSVASVVKTVEKTTPIKKDIIYKSSLEMMQKDLKDAADDINNKLESDASARQQSQQRSSVFSRLGTNNSDIRRTKLSKETFIEPDTSPQDRQRSPLKRSIQEYIDEDDKSDEEMSQPKIKRVENRSLSTNFIVTLRGAEKLNVPLTSRLGPKKTVNPMSIADELSLDDDQFEVELEHAVSVEDEYQNPDSKDNSVVAVHEPSGENQFTRCRFWPSCKNKETCPFVHPSEPCKMFPNCKFGAQCLFIHPNCRFSTNCTKPDCPYTHYGPRILTAAVKPATALSGTRCAYYPNCHNVNCKFFHPNHPCKYGISCKLKSTCLYYHPSIPNINELKWTAASATIIDATSNKKSEIESV